MDPSNNQHGKYEQASAAIFCEFFESALHAILYIRGLYPSGAFETRKKYGVPVQMCVHPEVRAYIDNIAKNLLSMIENGQLHAIDVCIVDHKLECVEKFSFEIIACTTLTSCSCEDLLELEQTFRAMLLKINLLNNVLPILPDDSSWKIEVHTNQSTYLDFQDKQLIKDLIWILKDEHVGTTNSNFEIVPVKSSKSTPLQIQLFVQVVNR